MRGALHPWLQPRPRGLSSKSIPEPHLICAQTKLAKARAIRAKAKERAHVISTSWANAPSLSANSYMLVRITGRWTMVGVNAPSWARDNTSPATLRLQARAHPERTHFIHPCLVLLHFLLLVSKSLRTNHIMILFLVLKTWPWKNLCKSRRARRRCSFHVYSGRVHCVPSAQHQRRRWCLWYPRLANPPKKSFA